MPQIIWEPGDIFTVQFGWGLIIKDGKYLVIEKEFREYNIKIVDTFPKDAQYTPNFTPPMEVGLAFAAVKAFLNLQKSDSS